MAARSAAVGALVRDDELPRPARDYVAQVIELNATSPVSADTYEFITDTDAVMDRDAPALLFVVIQIVFNKRRCGSGDCPSGCVHIL
jgi:hypothetical protein